MSEEPQQGELWSREVQSRIPKQAIKKQSLDREGVSGPICPTSAQIEKLRLILSTYQDGTGMIIKDGRNLPGWRDFERAVAIAFNGKAQESKHVFDVIVPGKDDEDPYGISCKMRGELSKSSDRRSRNDQFLKGRISMEMSNAAKY